MRSFFNIPRGMLFHYFKTNTTHQGSRLKYPYFKKIKFPEIMDRFCVESNGELLQEQGFLFKPSATQRKANGSFSCSKQLALDVHGRFRKHRIGLNSLCSMFSTEINKINKMNTKKAMDYGGDFSDLCQYDTAFVDKSLFIKEVIEDKFKVLLITMPRRWGKSLNLNMLKRFLSIEEQNQQEKQINKKIFSGEKDVLLNITKSEIRNKKALEFQGKYPVIFLNFQNCKEDTYEKIKFKLKKTIIDTIQSYVYLAQSKKKLGRITIGQKYNQILSLAQSENFSESIKDLSKLLYVYHGKKVWILIDEYDAAANIAYLQFSDQDAKQVSKLFSKVLQPALKSNQYLEKCVMTGVQYILKSGTLSGLNNIKKHNFASSKYAKYYGIDQSEMDKLLKQIGIENEADKLEIKKWYNGYKQNRGTPKEPNYIDKYNIWSVVNYLEYQGVLRSYWEDNNSLSTVLNNDILNHTAIKQKVEDLLSDKKFVIKKFVSDFSVDNFRVLKAILKAHDKIKISSDGVDLFFSYLTIGGYLTQTSQDNIFALPNKEIKNQFEEKLKTYYDLLFPISQLQLKSVTEELNLLFKEQSQENIKKILYEGFAPKFQALIQDFKIYHKDNDKETIVGFYGNEDLWHSLLNFIAMQIPDVKFATQRYTKINTQKKEKKGRADICLSKNDKSVIIEVKYQNEEEKPKNLSESLKSQALQQAKRYKMLTQNTRNNIFVGCIVTSEKKVLLSHHISLESDGNNRK